MLELRCGEFDVFISDQPDYVPGSRRFSRETCLSDDDYYLSSHHAVIVRQNGKEITSHLLAADGASGIHQHSALIHENQLFLAVGDCLCALEIPSLDLVWRTKVDMATCFGVHLPPRRDCLISHGELEITRVSFDGTVKWQNSGADIFTGDFQIFEDFIEAEDWNGRLYRIEIETGKSGLI